MCLLYFLPEYNLTSYSFVIVFHRVIFFILIKSNTSMISFMDYVFGVFKSHHHTQGLLGFLPLYLLEVSFYFFNGA